ncbi:cucumisin-like [Prosopis cineraria]|uniref:cucumisin-like n=1 Tax=Prosopis cineraria TaxID=364024 RepID=UPI00240F85C5|nr:cucumisin-like [Prosopis cineraria]XP_054796521.1 cucumisin-like [Prosopis cineraria]
MDSKSSASLLISLISFASLLLQCHSSSSDDLKTYIVYTGNSNSDEASALLQYTSLLRKAADSDAAARSVLHQYKRSFYGFVVKLTQKEAERMSGLDGVVSVFPNRKRQLHTTRSWDFIGFPLNVQRATTESDVIIGVLDSGIWPESESFSDKGLGSPPKKWKGTCQSSSNFTCNRKIIGAKYYKSDGSFEGEEKSPRDYDGHGTHISSTAAGNSVSQASMLGLAPGTARGGAVSARIAVYKVCWFDGCFDADILAAFDDAIADGVDILSVSLGGFSDENYFRDGLAIGAFHAMRNGILTVTSAGNSGPRPGSLANFSPWSISVAASTIDRKLLTKVGLGDNKIFEGVSINTFDLKGQQYPIIYGGDAPNTKEGFDGSSSRFCSGGTLDPNLVKGKIVLCEGRSQASGPFIAEAAGALTQGQNLRDSPLAFPLPASYMNLQDASNIFSYMNSTRNSTATIYRTNAEKDTLAPVVASFSARGPNRVSPDILKPDLVAPGVNILASWSPKGSISEVDGDNRTLKFNIISGTSMSCPHVSGAAAYVKSFHPSWSPSAIQSALMTSARPLNPRINRDAEFAYGAGQIDPVKAVNPGLVYDAGEIDFVRFLCGQGYSTRTLQLVTGDSSSCSVSAKASDLNYPSFALPTHPSNVNVGGNFSRTVTYVGSEKSTYKATVTGPPGLKIQVNPNVLSFTSRGERQSFVLSVEGSLEASIVSASLVWSDGDIQVRSPIVVFNSP